VVELDWRIKFRVGGIVREKIQGFIFGGFLKYLVNPVNPVIIINEEDKAVEKWKCDVCGYIYDPKEGDPDNGVEPGTPFDKLPDGWICPVCGAGKDVFTKI